MVPPLDKNRWQRVEWFVARTHAAMHMVNYVLHNISAYKSQELYLLLSHTGGPRLYWEVSLYMIPAGLYVTIKLKFYQKCIQEIMLMRFTTNYVHTYIHIILIYVATITCFVTSYVSA